MAVNIRIRAYPFAPNDFKIFTIGSDSLEVPASPEHQRVLYDLENDRLPQRYPAPPYTLCVQTLVSRLSEPIFSLELPQYGSRYVLESTDGVSQFYFEPINRFHGQYKPGNAMGPIKFEPYCNQFFSGRLEPLPWTLFNLFSYLYPYNWSSVCRNPSIHGHYMVNIFFDSGVDQPESDNYNTSTAYCMCDDTLLTVVFEMLSREKLRGEFTLGQVVYGGDSERFFLKPYTYERACANRGMRLKDLTWTTINGNELHLWCYA